MRHSCIVKTCQNNAGQNRDVDLFYLPVDKKTARVWLTLVQRSDLIEAVGRYEYHRVCSKHFSEKQFSSNSNFNRPRLVPHAVPDILLPSGASTARTVKLKKFDGSAVPVSLQAKEKAEIKASDVLQLKQEHVPSQHLQMKDLQNDSNLQKKVVRLRLPPGVSVMEFASSDAMKNITNKLSGLINSGASANKRFVVKLQNPSEKSSVANAAAAADQEGSASTSAGTTSTTSNSSDGSANNSEMSATAAGCAVTTASTVVPASTSGNTSIQVVAATKVATNSSSSNKKVSFVEVNSEEEQSTTTSSSNGGGTVSVRHATRHNTRSTSRKLTVLSPKRSYTRMAGSDTALALVKKMRIEDRIEAATNSSSGISDDHTLPSADASGDTVPKLNNDAGGSKEGGSTMHYFDYQRQLASRQAQRMKLIDKIRHQKQLLVRRGNELCRYRMQLRKLRDRNNLRTEMTANECLRVLKGNMHPHALELLYTQLVGQDDPLPHTQQQQAGTNSVSGPTGAVGAAPAGDEENGPGYYISNSNQEVAYTPRVLESALLFSVAGKKAYKAMSQSLKLPSYSDIIKWKKIIRSNPPFYKKHFPNLRAKFFKKRKPEEKKQKRAAEEEGEDHEDWHHEGSKKHNSAGKNEEGASVTQDEADALYRKLMAEQEAFERLFVEEEEHTENQIGLEETDELPELTTEEEDIDWDIDAAEFIKRLKQREKLQLLGDDDWDNELEKLNEMDEEGGEGGGDDDAALTAADANNEAQLDCPSRPSHEMKAVNETINRVISAVIHGDDMRTEDTGVTTTVLDDSGNVVTVINGPQQLHSNQPLAAEGAGSGELASNGALFMDEERAIVAQTNSGDGISFVATNDGDNGLSVHAGDGTSIVSYVSPVEGTTGGDGAAALTLVGPDEDVQREQDNEYLEEEEEQGGEEYLEEEEYMDDDDEEEEEEQKKFDSSVMVDAEEGEEEDKASEPGPSMPQLF